MASLLETGFVPAVIETARIVNVNIEDWSVDLITEHAGKRFFDIQVSSPYFHYMGGEGMYAQPEVGALVWLCKPSDGEFSTPFIMGFQSPYDEDNASYRGNRQSLNPGDIMFRTRDDNFIVLRRGGAIQIGATSIAQRIYIPVRNFIRDFCENYNLETFGGKLYWETQRDDQTTTGDSPTQFGLLAKNLANDPKHIATLTVGSHGEDSETTLDLVVNDSGLDDGQQQVRLTITKTGNVTWDMEGNCSIAAKQTVSVLSEEADVLVEAQQGNVEVTAGTDILLDAAANLEETVGGDSKENVTGTKTITAPMTNIGGPDATNPAILGTEMVTFLAELLGYLSINQATSFGAPLTQNASISALGAKLSGLLAQKVKVK